MSTVTISYASPATITISLASVATSSDGTAGRESTVVDNTTNKYVDALVSGKVRVGTTPTANTFINVYVYAQHDDTPTYQSVFTGSDANISSIPSAGVLASVVKLLGSLFVSATTSDRDYFLAPTSVAQLFGGVLPKRWGLYVTHNSGVNLNSTGGNHEFKYTGIKFDVA